MEVIIYSSDPKIDPITFEVSDDNWIFRDHKYIKYDNPSLSMMLYFYATDFVGKLPKPLEDIIKKDPKWSKEYNTFMIKPIDTLKRYELLKDYPSESKYPPQIHITRNLNR